VAADIEGAAAARARLEETLAATLDERRTREQSFTAQLAEREREVEEREAARVTEAAAASTRIDALAAEADELRATVASLTAERERLAADAEGASAARARLEEALAHGLEEARAREQELSGRLAEREAELARIDAERAAENAAATTRIEAATADSDQLRHAVASLEAERDRLAAEAEGGAAARTRLEETLARTIDEARTEAETLRTQVAEREEELERVRREQLEDAISVPEALAEIETPTEPAATEAAVTEAAAPAAEPVAPPPPAEESADADGGVLVIDVDRSWDRIARPGREVTTAAPDGTAAAAAKRVRPAQVVVNLGAARVLDTLLALRADGCRAPFWGCVADASSGRALALGRVEPATRPLDPDAILASLGKKVPKGTRVVTIGDDVDAFVSLRQAFARDGMSVSMAWNAKQAADLIPMVRPTLVVLELGLPAAEANGILGKLAVLDPLPTTVLVPAAKDPGRGLAGAVADPAHRSMLVPIAEVIARALRRTG
jgi:hypothetical protein